MTHFWVCLYYFLKSAWRSNFGFTFTVLYWVHSHAIHSYGWYLAQNAKVGMLTRSDTHLHVHGLLFFATIFAVCRLCVSQNVVNTPVKANILNACSTSPENQYRRILRLNWKMHHSELCLIGSIQTEHAVCTTSILQYRD